MEICHVNRPHTGSMCPRLPGSVWQALPRPTVDHIPRLVGLDLPNMYAIILKRIFLQPGCVVAQIR